MILGQKSRYHSTRVITEDGRTFFGQWSQPKSRDVGERLYVITGPDVDRLDLVAYKMYGDPFLWWVIAWYNNILDPMSLEVGDRLRIPDYETLIPRSADRPPDQADSTTQSAPPIIKPYNPPPFQVAGDPIGGGTVIAQSRYEFNYGFLIPNVQGLVHFDLEVSTSEQFAQIVLSKSTSSSTERWSYFNPFLNNGGGAHESFPTEGLSAAALRGNPAYYRLTSDDALTPGTLYYVRHRAVTDDGPLLWNSPPPFVLRARS